MIIEKGKCIDKCENDNLYKFEYIGECFEKCPNGTKADKNNYFCKDIDLAKCKLTQKELTPINENITTEEVNKLAKNYAKYFNYTDNHVSVYNNSFYSITLYKNGYCISSLKLNISRLDFGICYEKVKEYYKIEDNLVIAIVTKNIGGDNSPKVIYYSLYDPKEGKNLSYFDICFNDSLIIHENIFSKIDTKNKDIESMIYLAEHDIDIFNLSGLFYTDIYYHFDSPIDKDIALQDRVLLFYPNVTLCENGCQTKGVNLSTFEAICECKFTNLINIDVLENNVLYKNSLGEIKSMISETNIEVIKCYKDLFSTKFYLSNLGFYIIVFFLICQIILTIIYYRHSLFIFTKYVFDISEQYLTYLTIHKNDNIIDLVDNKTLKNVPPKKKKKKTHLGEHHNIIRKKKKKAKTKLEDNRIIPINHRKRLSHFNKNTTFHNLISNEHTLNNYSNNNKISVGGSIYIYNKKLPKMKLSNDYFLEKDKNVLITSRDENFKNIEEYLQTDLDNMDYDDAVKKDKRKFCEFFWGKVKINQMILDTFCAIDHLRPRTLKIMLFILKLIYIYL